MKLFDFNNIKDANKLLRVRQLMLWIAGICIFSSVSLASGLALGLTFGVHTFELIIMVTFCGIMLITFVPSTFCFVWIAEIEKILTQRQIDYDCPIEEKIRDWALKMMFWFALVVLLPILIRKLIS